MYPKKCFKTVREDIKIVRPPPPEFFFLLSKYISIFGSILRKQIVTVLQKRILCAVGDVINR